MKERVLPLRILSEFPNHHSTISFPDCIGGFLADGGRSVEMITARQIGISPGFESIENIRVIKRLALGIFSIERDAENQL